MVRTYTIYALTLLSAFVVFWTFGLMATVAAGYTWVPFSAFLASIFHFGLSSWMFLNFPKVGKVAAILSGVVMCGWPLSALVSIESSEWRATESVLYSIPILITAFVIFSHIKSFKSELKPNLSTRIWMSVLPFGLFIYYIIYIIPVIQKGMITFG